MGWGGRDERPPHSHLPICGLAQQPGSRKLAIRVCQPLPSGAWAAPATASGSSSSSGRPAGWRLRSRLERRPVHGQAAAGTLRRRAAHAPPAEGPDPAHRPRSRRSTRERRLPPRYRHPVGSQYSPSGPPSTSGPGHSPFKAVARVRIPLGAFARRPPVARATSRARSSPPGATPHTRRF